MGSLDHTFQGKWYYAGAVMFKKDQFADLNLRTLVGPGIGYRFFESKRFERYRSHHHPKTPPREGCH